MSIMLGTLTSCSDKGYWKEYVPEGTEYSFEQPKLEIETTDANTDITIKVVRSTKKGESTVGLTADKVSEGLTIPASVTFADGENVASVTVTLANAVPGSPYKATIGFEKDVVTSPSANTTVALSVSMSYNWVSLGTGQFMDQFILGGKYYNVEIQQAEGFGRYRVIKPYDEGMATDDGEWEDWRTGEYPAYIEFWESGDQLTWNPWNTGIIYQANPGDYIVAYPGNYFNGATTANNVWYKPGYAILSPYYYIDDVGGWNYTGNAGVVQIILPE